MHVVTRKQKYLRGTTACAVSLRQQIMATAELNISAISMRNVNQDPRRDCFMKKNRGSKIS
jgi:hypothetical protein